MTYVDTLRDLAATYHCNVEYLAHGECGVPCRVGISKSKGGSERLKCQRSNGRRRENGGG